MNRKKDEPHRPISIHKRFSVPPAEIWQAWTDPNIMKRWFGSDPRGEVREATADVRIGGAFEVTFADSDGSQHTCLGVYRNVVERSRLVFTWAWKERPEATELVTVALDPDGDGTLMHFEHADIDPGTTHDYAAGWKTTFEKLESAVLAGHVQAASGRRHAANPEMIQTLDGNGQPTGVKTREDVHRDADWHMLVFVWVASRSGDGFSFLLQLRGRRDDRFFGHVDAPAGGHVPAGEDHLHGALRECEEEMGVRLEENDLLYLGQRRIESLGMDCKRTFQHHYLCRRPLGLADVSHTPEVHGFVEADLDEFMALVSGRTETIMARRKTRDAPRAARAMLDSRSIALYTEEVKETFRLVSEATRFAVTQGKADPRIFSGRSEPGTAPFHGEHLPE